ncbi:ferritin-like domain-containing protein [Pandoraea sp.]|uniref:ferritin-like domain-containing protein n=1 Tax=Pandoraea sp. TaxID=1883445 RepID=UPI00121DEE69|nr:ferritin-like domain-containing protein [Pandoraea sp.]TAL54430.1 MAG: ferritin-like domain-containing protein [Pandoraea sp.]TAM17479.1 MAG: ferritin-like domain-containing protein [Pandoraea sp.]
MSAEPTVRSDAFTFYALATLSFVESSVPEFVSTLNVMYADDPEMRDWLRETWLREEIEHGRLARTYIAKTWPEFDWQPAYDAFLVRYKPLCDVEYMRPSLALEALSRCVIETETAMIYRCLEAEMSDPELKAMMRKLSSEEVGHYRYFRKTFDRYNAAERHGVIRRLHTIVKRSEMVRDEDIAIAFEPLSDAAFWRGPKPFEEMTWQEFLEVSGDMMKRRLPVEAATRMMFKPLETGVWWRDKPTRALLSFMVKRQYPQLAGGEA